MADELKTPKPSAGVVAPGSRHPNVTRRMSGSPPRKVGFTGPKQLTREDMLREQREIEIDLERQHQFNKAFINVPVQTAGVLFNPAASFAHLRNTGEPEPIQFLEPSAPPAPPPIALPPATLYEPYGLPAHPVTPMTQREADERGAFKQLMVEIMHEVVGNTPHGRTRVSLSGHGDGGDDPSSSDDEGKGKGPPRGRSSFPIRGLGSGGGGGKGGRGSSGAPGGGGGSSSSSESDSDKSMDSNSEIFKGISALKANRRRQATLSSSVISDAVPAHMRSVEALNLRPLPTKANLILRDFEIHNIMSFLKKFESLQQEFEQPLKMAMYFSDTVLTRVQNESIRFRKLNRLLDGRDLLYRGKQLLSNDQVEDLLRSVCKPVSVEEMKKILRKSVYDPEMYKFFASTTVIMKNFSLYCSYATTYLKQYLARMVMIVDEKNAKYLPRLLDGGSGKGDAKEKGLIQYFTLGFPNRKFANRLWRKGVDERVRKKCKTFDEFVDLYFDVLYKLEKTLRRQYANVLHIFNDDADDGDPEGPHDYRRDRENVKKSSSSRKYGRSRGRFEGSVNAMVAAGDDHDDDSDGDSSDGEPPDADPDAEVQEAVDSDDSDDQKPVESKEEGDLDEVKDIPAEDEWLQNMVMDPQGKRPPPCWKFATTGKCQYGDQCRFSHHPDDAKAYNAAKTMGHSTFRSISTQKPDSSLKDYKGHGSSPGVRPKVPTPTSIERSDCPGS